MCVAATFGSITAVAQVAPTGAENAALVDEIVPEVDRAVSAGLSFLASSQAKDGSFGQGRYGRNVAVSSLACLAFMSD